jgi:hypothetical protein
MRLPLRDRRHTRSVPRQPVAWAGRYRLADRDVALWHDCLVVDVSLGGAGLELFGPTPSETLVTVELCRIGSQPNGLQLRARVRHAGETPDGTARVGVEFEALSDLERALLDSLVRQESEGSDGQLRARG